MASLEQCGASCKLKEQQNQKAKDCLSNRKIRKKIIINGSVDQERQVFCRKRIRRVHRKNQIKKLAEGESGSQSQNQKQGETDRGNCQTQNSQDNKLLTYDHLEQFKKVYSLVGSNWIRILRILNQEHQIFLGSSADELKNLFCNSMRKVAKLFQNENWNTRRRMVKNAKSYLLSMLEIVNQADRVMLENGLKPNPQSFMQKFKSHILTLCFGREDWSQQVVSQLLEATRYLGKKMKCFGIFKVKNKKNWKLTKQSFIKMREFDRITLNDLDNHADSFDINNLMEHDEQLNRSWMQRSFPNTQIKLKLFEQEKEGIEQSDPLNLVCDQSRSFILF